MRWGFGNFEAEKSPIPRMMICDFSTRGLGIYIPEIDDFWRRGFFFVRWNILTNSHHCLLNKKWVFSFGARVTVFWWLIDCQKTRSSLFWATSLFGSVSFVSIILKPPSSGGHLHISAFHTKSQNAKKWENSQSHQETQQVSARH